MRNLLLTLSFNGGAYHGWQIQPNGNTVQAEIMKAFSAFTGETPNVIGCSRTDAGVHANMFCCNIRTDSEMDSKKIIGAFNALLPSDISVYDCRDVSADFHARYSCLGKEYIYRIWNCEYPNPFEIGRALHVKRKIDESALNKAAQGFVGTHDFCGFCSVGSSVQDTVRTVFSAGVERKGDLITFSVSGDGFLYNMVRIMAGTLLAVADGKILPNDIHDIVESGDRNRAGVTAPAQGLYLNRIFYGGDICGAEKEDEEKQSKV